MPIITLPDGSQREFPQPVSGFEIVSNIGTGLAKAAAALDVDGVEKDLSTIIAQDCHLSVLTANTLQGLTIFRHTIAAQILARAIKIMYPTAKLAIGPTIEHGFYYDIDFEDNITPEALPSIEAKMREIIKEDLPITRELWDRQTLIYYFQQHGEAYKIDIIQRAPETQTQLSVYRQGHGDTNVFLDLCYGPHLPNTGKAGQVAFTLTNVAGAYWRGDSKNKMLTRIYGLAFANDKALKAHQFLLEEAQKRDHRKIGKALNLFHIQEDAPGMVFWHADGWSIWQTIEQYMRKRQQNEHYQEVKTPIIADRSLWEKSGHWTNYRDNMFTTASENREYAIKPMNCPCHVQIFNHGLHSYRDLPLRLAEFGSCHRNEPSGALHGIMRVRGFVQDDGHIFCREDQIISEVSNFHRFAMSVYHDFGFTQVQVKLSLRPEKRSGSDAVWDLAEDGLRSALSAAGITWEELPGEGAFYGPKVEYHIQDAIGRSWQLGTIQLDFVLPSRLDAEFVDEDNTRKPPVMLHRAILGSFERFIGILIEHHAGSLPLWLAPTQVIIMGISVKQVDYLQEIADKLKKVGIRTKSDLRNEKIGYKIREATMNRIPLMLVVGNHEQEQGLVAVRNREGQDLGTMTLTEFITFVTQHSQQQL